LAIQGNKFGAANMEGGFRSMEKRWCTYWI